jgi:hypothetical protein
MDCLVLVLIKLKLAKDLTELAKAAKRLIKAIHDLWKKK